MPWLMPNKGVTGLVTPLHVKLIAELQKLS